MVLGWLSCTPEKKAEDTESPAAVPLQPVVRTPAADTSANRVLTAQITDPENDQPVLPVKILTAGVFHEDEVWEGVEQEKWFGLFKDGHGYYLRATALRAERVEDPLGEEEGQKTGWELKTALSDTVVLLMTGSNDLADRRLSTAHLDTNAVYPGDTLAVKFGDREYYLFATGNKEKESPNNQWYVISNYRLYLSTKVDGRQVNQLLVAHENFDDAMTHIIWAGDIDGDNRLDLIINLARHYNEGRPTLFLSKPAPPVKLLELSGQHQWVGC
jgi:hypothetical protein